MNALKSLSRKSISQWRGLKRCTVAHQSTAAQISPSEPLTVPPPDGADKIYSSKLEKIAGEITTLNLLEVSELSQLLKKRLNLPDQPVMPMGGFMMQAAAKSNEEEEVSVSKAVQTEFTVTMKSFDDKQKVATIKEIKNVMEGFNLVQAKKFVENLPAVVRASISKEEAEELKATLSKVGAVIDIV